MLKYIVITLVIALLIILIRLQMLGSLSKKGNAPGLQQGKLAVCSNKPNCICSQYPESETHFIEPLSLQDHNAADVWQQSKAVLLDMGATITEESEHYLAATFTSTIFGFVDDVELLLDTQTQHIHMRSASRVGHSDLGANQQRMRQWRDRVSNE